MHKPADPVGVSSDLPTALTGAIRAILAEHGRLAADISTLSDDTDLYEAGLTSHASVNLMLALEEHFQVEFPEHLLQRRTFATIAAIRSAVQELVGADT